MPCALLQISCSRDCKCLYGWNNSLKDGVNSKSTTKTRKWLRAIFRVKKKSRMKRMEEEEAEAEGAGILRGWKIKKRRSGECEENGGEEDEKENAK